MYKLLVSMSLGMVFTYIFIYFGEKLKVYGQKSFRRIKEESVPQLGGVGIVATLVVAGLIFNDKYLLHFLVIASPIIVGGAVDDFKELSARNKLMFQFLSAALIITLDYDSLLWAQWNQHTIITSVLTVFFVVTLCNAMNFIDGLDGLVASFALAVLPLLYLVPNNLNSSVLIILGAILAFAFYNKKPAKVYLGDVGSNLIGLILAYGFLTHEDRSVGKHFAVLAFLMVFSLPLIDLTTSTIRRMMSGLSPFSSDKDHIHHRLLKVGLNDSQVAIIFFAVGALCANVGWVLLDKVPAIQKWSLLSSSVSVLLIILYMVYRTEGQLGKHISHFGRTLIETYINLTETSFLLPESDLKRALILDLFNYYKELQRQGLPKVVSFVKDVSGFITFKFKGARVMLLSSYSIAIICDDKNTWNKKEIQQLQNDFRRLTDKHRATRLGDGHPEGMYFYDSDEFQVFYREAGKKHELSQNKSVA